MFSHNGEYGGIMGRTREKSRTIFYFRVGGVSRSRGWRRREAQCQQSVDIARGIIGELRDHKTGG